MTKWVEVHNSATSDQPSRSTATTSTATTSTATSSVEVPAEPVLAQLTVERLHVPWHLRQRLHCETDFMPQIGAKPGCLFPSHAF